MLSSTLERRIRRITPIHPVRAQPASQLASRVWPLRTLAERGSSTLISVARWWRDRYVMSSWLRVDPLSSTHARRETGTLTCNWVDRRMTLHDPTDEPLSLAPLRSMHHRHRYHRRTEVHKLPPPLPPLLLLSPSLFFTLCRILNAGKNPGCCSTPLPRAEIMCRRVEVRPVCRQWRVPVLTSAGNVRDWRTFIFGQVENEMSDEQTVPYPLRQPDGRRATSLY